MNTTKTLIAGAAMAGLMAGSLPVRAYAANTSTQAGVSLQTMADEKNPVVDWFEIISENFMVDGGRPLEVLDLILEQYRVVQHGVAIYFGSADKLNHEHLRKLKRLVKRTNTPWLSDHLCWGSVDGRYTQSLPISEILLFRR